MRGSEEHEIAGRGGGGAARTWRPPPEGSGRARKQERKQPMALRKSHRERVKLAPRPPSRVWELVLDPERESLEMERAERGREKKRSGSGGGAI